MSICTHRSETRNSNISRRTGFQGPAVMRTGPQSHLCIKLVTVSSSRQYPLTQWYCAFRTLRRLVSPLWQMKRYRMNLQSCKSIEPFENEKQIWRRYVRWARRMSFYTSMTSLQSTLFWARSYQWKDPGFYSCFSTTSHLILNIQVVLHQIQMNDARYFLYRAPVIFWRVCPIWSSIHVGALDLSPSAILEQNCLLWWQTNNSC